MNRCEKSASLFNECRSESSSKQLSPSEISLLSKDLTFCPLPSRPDTFQLKKDFVQFSRRLRLKEYFWDSEDDDQVTTYKPLKSASTWTPPPNWDAAVESYIKVINDNIQEQVQRPRKSRRGNLTKEEREALVSLRSRNDIVIKKAAKGSATVVMSRDQYVAEVMRQFNTVIWKIFVVKNFSWVDETTKIY